MRGIFLALATLLLAAATRGQSAPPNLSEADRVRVREFYQLVDHLRDKVWPGMGATPAPILLVTKDTEFLLRYPAPPKEFQKIDETSYARPRQFPTALLATFPAFGPPSVIVVGEPENTEAKTSTPWLFVLMHEHFHQLQDAQPGFLEAAAGLGLAHGDNTGMWMLNYPFPYDKPEVGKSFVELRDLLLAAVTEHDEAKFRLLAKQYADARKKFYAQLAPDDAKYLKFQLWKEGIARYVQIKSAEAAADYQSTREFAGLADYETFESYAKQARNDTLSELKKADLAQWKRVVVYSFGACEGLLLDRLDPQWKDGYFRHLFSLDPYFEK